MYFYLKWSNLVLLIILVVKFCEPSKILVVLPFGAKSHYNGFKPYLLELANRGHNLTIISPFPLGRPDINDIDGSKYLDLLIAGVPFDFLKIIPTESIYNLFILSQFDRVTKMFDIPKVRQMIDSNSDSFDLIIYELFDNEVPLGFVWKYKCPSIGISTTPLMPWANTRFANPDNPSYVPVLYTHYPVKMNLIQRTYNAIVLTISNLAYAYYFDPKSEAYWKKYFKLDEIPCRISDIAKNTSLVFVNTHPSLHGSRPMNPSIIEVGGIHLTDATPLPKDLKKFIDESKHGVIYFCMGSMLRSSTLPEEKRLAFIKVFSKLPQRVLWKWETETMPDKPENVKLVKWMPQRDVLAHPNVKLFISHGGLLGTTEAVHSGVPILGIPFYGDQGVNIEAVKANGAGLRLDFNDINVESFSSAINQLLNDPKYKLNAVSLSERFRDRPQTPLETAVYWTEYVIRHKGAPHLRSAAVDLAWYQYLLLDVIVFLLVSFVIICFIVTFIIKRIYRLLKNVISPSNKSKSDKRKKE